MKTPEQINKRIAQLKCMVNSFNVVNAEVDDWGLYDSWITEIKTLKWVLGD